MSRFNLEHFASAEQAFRQAIRVGPARSRYHFWLGFALEREGRISEAKTEYEKELSDHPGTDTRARERLEGLEKQTGIAPSGSQQQK